MNPEDVDLESHLGVTSDRLDEGVRARIAEFVASREGRLAELRERALDAEQEASVLRSRVESLQAQVESLESQAGDNGAGPDLDTASLVAQFGDALSSERIAESGFTVSDLSVDLRANVANTEDGLRVMLPAPGSQPPPESLSELRFSVRSDPGAAEPDLEKVPDFVGMTETGARERLSDAGFEVGTVEAVEADAESGRVVDQLPSPYSLAEPGAPVDLEVAEAAEESVDLVGETFVDAVRSVEDRLSLDEIRAAESGEPAGTVIEQEPEPARLAPGEGLSLTIAAYPEPTDEGEPAEAADEPEDQPESTGDAGPEGAERPLAADLLEAAAEATPDGADPLVELDVEEIDGIGDTYGQRLRNAGVESLADLAQAEPTRVADAANVPDDRAAAWVDAALTVARSRAGEGEDA